MNHQPCEHEIDITDLETTNSQSCTEQSNNFSALTDKTDVSQNESDDKSDQLSNTATTDVTMSLQDEPSSPDQEKSSVKKQEKRKEVSAQQVPLKRSNTSLNSKSFSLPKVNCKEKIILCIDNSTSMFSSIFKRTVQSIKQKSVFNVLIGALKQFIMTKSFINKKHEFSLMVLNEEAQLITQFHDQGADVIYRLQEISDNSQQSDNDLNEAPKQFDLSSLFQLIENSVNLPPCEADNIPPPYVVRVVLVFGRSNSSIGFQNGKKSFERLCQNPYFFIDCIYIHDEPDEGNDVTEIFSSLCDLDKNGTSYMLEASVDGSMSSLYNSFAKLCAHPLQRARQLSNHDLEIFDAS